MADAELTRASAQHDAYAASALVRRYIGLLDARVTIAGLEAYVPAGHLQKVEGKGVAAW